MEENSPTKAFRALCADRGLIRTTTGGDNYKSNGRVEALVGRAKNAVRTMLSATGLDAAYWSFAMRHYVAKMQWNVVTQLGGRYPRLPPFGTKVFVKKRSWEADQGGVRGEGCGRKDLVSPLLRSLAVSW